MSGEGGGGGRGNRAVSNHQSMQMSRLLSLYNNALLQRLQRGQRARVQGVTKGRGKKMQYLRTLAIFSLFV